MVCAFVCDSLKTSLRQWLVHAPPPSFSCSLPSCRRSFGRFRCRFSNLKINQTFHTSQTHALSCVSARARAPCAPCIPPCRLPLTHSERTQKPQLRNTFFDRLLKWWWLPPPLSLFGSALSAIWRHHLAHDDTPPDALVAWRFDGLNTVIASDARARSSSYLENVIIR